MTTIESEARAATVEVVRLETGIKQREAVQLYIKLGYRKYAPFRTYRDDPLSLFMEKKM